MIRVALADDHTFFRQGLRQLLELEPDMDIVGEAIDGFQALELARMQQPDVLLMDINMPKVDGISAIGEIVRTNPRIGIIALTMYREDGYIVRAVTAGARGYLLKDADSAKVVDAVRAVAAGQSQIDPGMTTKLLQEFRRVGQHTGEQGGPSGLTNRDVDLLKLIAAATAIKRSRTSCIWPKARSRTSCRCFSRKSTSRTARRPPSSPCRTDC